ncbi:NtaA/DmoA family FMN-dependent monooxygenase [Frondihabitans cladoniiphilus]|uniref:NtaA/DmoA family FMN-dependent monooxygenase n=1 Tax=Frondihabitans cladoniiphilus TaxID=715785 RepID=A0ABP8W3P3_9MICO
MFHLGWFTNPIPHGWTPSGRDVWAGNDVLPDTWATGEFLVDMAKSLERAGFDYIMLEDHVVLGDDESHFEPRLDPIPVAAVIAAATSRLGIVSTMSTSFYHPFQLARSTTTIDHLSRGRSGWNMVTSTEDRGARAFGQDGQPAHDERYDRADDFLDIVEKLWAGWDEDALVIQDEGGRYVDATKVHSGPIEGKYNSSYSPLNVPRGPQGRPVLCQAGSSPRGRDFAAKHADTVIATTFGLNSVSALKEFRDDLRERMVKFGRNPDDCKVLFLITPTVGETEEEALEADRRLNDPTPAIIDQTLSRLSFHTEHDWGQYDLDQPLPELDVESMTEGYQGMARAFLALGHPGDTLREIIGRHRTGSLDLVGTPAQVAQKMGEVIDEIGGDGFLIQRRPLTRRYITEICEGLVPELQKRGLVRSSYEFPTFRENLLAF